MSTTTITIRISIGDQVHEINLVGDPSDAMFATQVGREVSLRLLGYRTGEPIQPLVVGDGFFCDAADCQNGVSYWRRATCSCEMNVCWNHRQLQREAGPFWCAAHERRAQWFQERYLR